MVRPSSCIVRGGIPTSRRYLPTYLLHALEEPYQVLTNTLTLGQVLPWIPSQSCMHMGTFGKVRIGARAHKAVLYMIVDLLGKIERAIQSVPHALYSPYCLDSRVIPPLAWRSSFGPTATLAKF